jgi:hypothetical protein
MWIKGSSANTVSGLGTHQLQEQGENHKREKFFLTVECRIFCMRENYGIQKAERAYGHKYGNWSRGKHEKRTAGSA